VSPLLAAGCLLQIVDTSLSHDEASWLEQTTFEVGAEPRCDWVELPVPAGSELLALQGRALYGDGSRRRLGDERMERSERGADGAATVRVHTPELVGGDRLVLRVERRWHTATFLFAPGDARLATLALPSDADVDVLSGELQRDRRLWAEQTGDLRARVSPAVPLAPEPLPVGLPAGDVEHGRRMVLQVPRGNPQLMLYPGAGSVVRIDELYALSASTLPQSLAVPVEADQQVEVHAEPDGAVTFERGPDYGLITARPTEGPVRVTVTHAAYDAPTYGERGDLHSLVVDAPEGSVAWEGDGWRLAEWRRSPILPSGEHLVKALDHRFRSLAIPEPGLPSDLRGSPVTRELAAALRPTLLERAAVGLPGDPLWPRKLVKARRSGALTSTEAALVLWLYARQAGIRAEWALARPAPEGPGYRTTPAGYTHGLVRLGSGDEVLWVDPSCRVCAPFELPPELQGADVLSPGALSTPPPQPGASSLEEVDDGSLHWHLEGPPALMLRRWLQGVALAERPAAVAERVAGPGATLRSIEGLGQAGAPIDAVVVPGDGLQLDPLAMLPAPEGAAHWVDWVGTRSASWSTDDDPGPAELAIEGLTYRRTVSEGRVSEHLELTERTVDPSAVTLLEALRRGLGSSPGPTTPPSDPAAPLP
jgi:hypothetical protein